MIILAVRRWVPILSKLLGGQALIQIINLVTALLLLRLMPVGEYALFVAANLFISLGVIGSDLNLSTAFATFGARLAGGKSALSSLFLSVFYLRRWLYALIALIIPTMAPFVLTGHGWKAETIVIVLIIVLVTVWFQQSISLRSQVLNINHDLLGVFQSGLSGAITRLVLTYLFCLMWPVAISALFVNLVAVLVVVWVTKSKCKLYLFEGAASNEKDKTDLKKFIFPLIPSAIYFAFQGQIGLLLTSIMGNASSIAEVGALGRLGQIFVLLGVLNGFVFQPMFSRELKKERFILKFFVVTFALIAGFLIIFVSSYVVPDMWLWLLGKNYQSLRDEVPVALAGSIINYLAGYVYTLLAARAFTGYQSWNIVLTVLIQSLFIVFIGINTTYSVLMFNLLTGASTLFVQVILLGLMLKKWKSSQ